MLENLKRRWKVNNGGLILVIFTFALGGSLCGYAARKIMALTAIEQEGLWLIVYLLIATFLWPLCVLLFSIPLGQFSFFKTYLVKIWGAISGQKKTPTTVIAIFASGAGSNAQKIIEYFQAKKDTVKIALIVCNKERAGVLELAQTHGIETMIIGKDSFLSEETYIDELKKRSIDFIVLAGFLWKIPASLIKSYPNKIVNIHPALLPKYGGKGMYGLKVHEAVIAAGEKESGITIHYVDELYDHGNIIFQAACSVTEGETANSLAQKIHVLEHEHYPKVIENVLNMQNRR